MKRRDRIDFWALAYALAFPAIAIAGTVLVCADCVMGVAGLWE